MADVPPPHGVSLEDQARITAEIAEGDRPQAKVLEANKLSEPAWNEVTLFWMQKLSDDVQKNGDRARLPHVYSDAYAKAQGALKPLPEMDARGWAALTVAIQTAGDSGPPLAARALSQADFLRLARHWARVLSSDPEQAAVYFDAYQSLQPKPNGEVKT